MNDGAEFHAADGHWRLAGPLTIYTVGALRDAMLDAVRHAPRGDVVLDASGIAEVDSAGVQLLIAAAHQLRASGRAARLDGAPAALLATARALGAADADRCCSWTLQTRG